MFNTVLIANRGEIACRAIRTLQRLGIKSVAVYSDADKNAEHVKQADVAVALGGEKASDSYLRIDKIIDAARETGAQAIWPGYGFLSESLPFAAACEQAGIVFVGPTAQQIGEFGLKHRARELAAEAGVPMTPGTGLLDSLEEAQDAAAKIGYPVMLKSTAGGGGIGLTRCADAQALNQAWESVRRLGEQFLAMLACSLSVVLIEPDISKCRSLVTVKAMWWRSASVTAHCSAAIRKWWRKPRHRTCLPPPAKHYSAPPYSLAGWSTTAARAPWNSSMTLHGMRFIFWK